MISTFHMFSEAIIRERVTGLNRFSAGDTIGRHARWIKLKDASGDEVVWPIVALGDWFDINH
jgi:hypothetical protein